MPGTPTAHVPRDPSCALALPDAREPAPDPEREKYVRICIWPYDCTNITKTNVKKSSNTHAIPNRQFGGNRVCVRAERALMAHVGVVGWVFMRESTGGVGVAPHVVQRRGG